MPTVQAMDPASKVVSTFTNGQQLANAIQQLGYVPIRANGSAYNVQIFEGGYLLDGAPINVVMGGYWFTGQQQALLPYWQNGTVPTPTAAILALPTQGMPADIAAATQAYVSSQGEILGLPWYVWAGAAAAYFLL